MRYDVEKKRILAQAHELSEKGYLGAYRRKAKEKDDWYEGPVTRWEYFKAFWKDQWDGTTDASLWVLTLIGVAAATQVAIASSDSINRRITDTDGYDRSCMLSCKSIDGLMIERTRYGCTCYLHEGGKKVLR